MKRVNIYRNKSEQDGKLITVEDSLENVLSQAATLFQLSVDNVQLYSANDCQIHDIRAIRDEEKIYIGLSDEASSTVTKSIENLSVCDVEEKTVSDWITLNVGGKHFTTSRSTLLAKEPMSMLARMFAGDDDNEYLMKPSARDASGAYLIDRSSVYFEPILNYLRHGEVILDKHVNPRGVLEEAVFYGIDSMIPQLNEMIESLTSNTGTSQALNRMDVVKALIMTPISSELRFQGVNLAGADLNKLDLRNINFKYACLSYCNLSGANLSNCCLERADLSHANLEGAQLIGVKALCANMEGANLEDSNMSGVNLRVATLKNANLQNCVLRTAVLAGANLECCDLSGSDLHEANLRGANLKDAAFELMLTPLHMSQTIR
ncbi:BTB/POZ domain-containing protein KCTD9 isoform X2 [Cydia amplana]|uniref:BTB/POZ domain-containing protein KCTD9 isoform X2 n=1 Tax=Cydia amplana TaxID=1869771 RepID=UPI002FE5B35E